MTEFIDERHEFEPQVVIVGRPDRQGENSMLRVSSSKSEIEELLHGAIDQDQIIILAAELLRNNILGAIPSADSHRLIDQITESGRENARLLCAFHLSNLPKEEFSESEQEASPRT